MTPAEAERWAAQAAIWVCCATPEAGTIRRLLWLAESLTCRYRLGEHHETLRMARQSLAYCLASGDPCRQTRLLLIFVRRLTRHVDGYVPPRCGRCSDTGIEHYRSGRNVWPIACHACYPEQHDEQLRFRLANQAAARRVYGGAP